MVLGQGSRGSNVKKDFLRVLFPKNLSDRTDRMFLG